MNRHSDVASPVALLSSLAAEGQGLVSEMTPKEGDRPPFCFAGGGGGRMIFRFPSTPHPMREILMPVREKHIAFTWEI